MVLLRHLLGDALRRLRLRQGRTLREVSASARVSLGYLSEVERGQKEASSELLGSICSALGTPLSQVLRDVSDNVALAELQNEPVLTGARDPRLSVGPSATPVAPAAPGPSAAVGSVRLAATTGGRQLAVQARSAIGAPTIGAPARIRLPMRSGRNLDAPGAKGIDAVSLQDGTALSQLGWRAPDMPDMVPV